MIQLHSSSHACMQWNVPIKTILKNMQYGPKQVVSGIGRYGALLTFYPQLSNRGWATYKTAGEKTSLHDLKRFTKRRIINSSRTLMIFTPGKHQYSLSTYVLWQHAFLPMKFIVLVAPECKIDTRMVHDSCFSDVKGIPYQTHICPNSSFRHGNLL